MQPKKQTSERISFGNSITGSHSCDQNRHIKFYFPFKIKHTGTETKSHRSQSWTKHFFLFTEDRHNQDGKYKGKINTVTAILPRIYSYSTVFLLESLFSSLPMYPSLSYHPTQPPAPTTPLAVPFSFFPFFSWFFSLVTSIHSHTVHIPPPSTCTSVSHPWLKNLARMAEFEL